MSARYALGRAVLLEWAAALALALSGRGSRAGEETATLGDLAGSLGRARKGWARRGKESWVGLQKSLG